jgi:hypothetical protein
VCTGKIGPVEDSDDIVPALRRQFNMKQPRLLGMLTDTSQADDIAESGSDMKNAQFRSTSDSLWGFRGIYMSALTKASVGVPYRCKTPHRPDLIFICEGSFPNTSACSW